MPLRNIVLALALVLSAIGIQPAEAKIIYTYSANLVRDLGPDTGGLNGASAILTFDVVTPGVYVDRFGFPAIPVSNPQLTISGASVAANNGTFALPAVAFYPKLAGFRADPGLISPVLFLPGGTFLTLNGNTGASPGSANAFIGSAVELDDFVPAFGLSSWTASDGTYYLTNAKISAVNSVAVPEPGTLCLMAAGLVGAGAFVRRRKSRKV